MAHSADEARRLASDPSTPLAVLYELAQAHPEVHPALALNPSTYPDLLAWLRSLGRADVDAALDARSRGGAAGPGVIGSAIAGAVAGTAAAPTDEPAPTIVSGIPVADQAPAGATVAIPLAQMREAAAPQARSAEDADESMHDAGPLPERPGLPAVIRLPNSPDEAPSGIAAGPTEILPTRRSRLREQGEVDISGAAGKADGPEESAAPSQREDAGNSARPTLPDGLGSAAASATLADTPAAAMPPAGVVETDAPAAGEPQPEPETTQAMPAVEDETAAPDATQAMPAVEDETIAPEPEPAAPTLDEHAAPEATQAIPAVEDETAAPDATQAIPAVEDETIAPEPEPAAPTLDEHAAPEATQAIPAVEDETAAPDATQAMPAVEDETIAPEPEPAAPTLDEHAAPGATQAMPAAESEPTRPVEPLSDTSPIPASSSPEPTLDAPDATQAMPPVAEPSPAMPAAIPPVAGVAGAVAPSQPTPVYPAPGAPSQPTPALPPQQTPQPAAPAFPQQAPQQQPLRQQSAPPQSAHYGPDGAPPRQSVFAPGARPGSTTAGGPTHAAVYGPGGPGHAPSAASAPPVNWQTTAAPTYAQQQYSQPGYPPQQGGYYGAPTQQRPAKKGLPLAAWIGIGAGVALLVLAAIWFASLMSGNGDPAATISPTEAATASEPTSAAPTATPTAEPTPEATTTPAGDLAAASTALTTAVTGSTCTDAWIDGQAFAAYQSAATDAGQAGSEEAIATARDAISALQERCNARYATTVAIEAGTADAELSHLTTNLDWRSPVELAPSGASGVTSFASPSGNINCTVSGSGAACAIASYDFAPPAGCAPGSPVTLVVDETGARADCGVAVGTGSGALGYGSATVVGDFACTSEESGVRCWDTLSGASISLARAAGTATDPVLGSADG